MAIHSPLVAATTFSWPPPPRNVHVWQDDDQLEFTIRIKRPTFEFGRGDVFSIGANLIFPCLFLGFIIAGGEPWTMEQARFILLISSMGIFFILEKIILFFSSVLVTVNFRSGQLTLSSGWWLFRKRQAILLHDIARLEAGQYRSDPTVSLIHRDEQGKAVSTGEKWHAPQGDYLKLVLKQLLAKYEAEYPTNEGGEPDNDLSAHLLE